MVYSQFKVGGSLQNDDPTYVVRRADYQLYTALLAGEFCYVFNSRQMGKSSMLVRAKHQLEKEGYLCTHVDMTRIGSRHITPLQWYKGVVGDLWRGLGCVGKINLKTWWQEREEISLLQRLSEFIELLLNQFPEQKLCIFIDEIDSILSLEFPVDDFFALIRYCYNQRSLNREYNRISFALFGVATPSDLIRDKTRTPFNIGTAIDLYGFSSEEALPLALGFVSKLERPHTILKEILAWSGGQPFLTQKLCQLVDWAVQEKHTLTIPPGTEEYWVESIVRQHVIENWESLDEPEHLRTIRDRLLHNENRAGRLLGIYQQILQGVQVPADDSREQIELLLSGLVIKQHSFLQVKNRIYAEVFNIEWVEKQLGRLRPYSQAFDAWIASAQRDSSRLLRGQALIDALSWAQGKSLSDLDYRFLANSTEVDRLEVQLTLEAQRSKEVEARLVQEKKAASRQKLLLLTVSLALLVTSLLGGATYFQYKKAVSSENQARISEIKALVSSSEGLFASHQRLDALVEAIKATRRLQKINSFDANIKEQVKNALAQAVYGADEYNRLSGHQSAILAVDISPDSSVIASASADNTIKLWRRDGTLLKTLTGHNAAVRAVNFSRDGKKLVSASEDRTLKIWQLDGEPALFAKRPEGKEGFPPQATGEPRRGKLLKTLTGHNAPIWSVKFSPDGQLIASASTDKTIKLWSFDGTLIKTLTGHIAGVSGVAFSPDSQIFVSVSQDNMLKFWRRDGQLLKTILTPSENTKVAFASLIGTPGTQHYANSPNGQIIATSSGDNTVKLWNRDGKLLKTFPGHTAVVSQVAFSRDGQIVASSSLDKTIKLRHISGAELATFRGHSGPVWALAWSPDGSFIASAGTDNVIKLWQSQNPLLSTITAHQNGIYGVDISSDSTTIATAGIGQDNTVKLWDQKGKLLATFVGHKAPVIYVNISPDGKLIASASLDSTVKLWQRDGTLVRTLSGFKAMVTSVAFSPDGKILAASSQDDTVKLWKLDGTLIKTFTGSGKGLWRGAFSPDGTRFAVGSGDGSVKIWKLDGTLERSFPAHSTTVWVVAFSPNPPGGLIASGSADGTIKLWKLDGTLLRTFTGHRAAVWGISFSPDGKTIASASVDNQVKLWKLDGTELATLRGHTSAVRGVKVSHDGTFLASVAEDNKLILWNLPQILNLNLLAEGCSRVRDYLRTNAAVEEGDRNLCARVDRIAK
ncbi:AAA-like domain-containing protein [Iningainema sp. BLCCT55]|uniref:AAA-like domain-containing protein n=2 Tax=Iningainema TaxID=1932705 RepID=A0A8J6XUB4_9CYAN|nr:AAA-like domain-containing protein [Iningainema tapete]MBD2777741.1 AAA-like domain-containing protein [Iningainema tapete BLCC-T55]